MNIGVLFLLQLQISGREKKDGNETCNKYCKTNAKYL